MSTKSNNMLDIYTVGRSHLYEIAKILSANSQLNRINTFWPKSKFNQLPNNIIKSHFISFLPYFAYNKFFRHSNLLFNLALQTLPKKSNNTNNVLIDSNLQNIISKLSYKNIILDNPTTYLNYQHDQWKHEIEYLGFDIKRYYSSTNLIKDPDINYNLAHKIIVPSKFSENSFPDKYKHKIMRVPYWIPTIDSPKKINCDNVISFVGIVCPSKGLHYLFESLQMLNSKKIKLNIFGEIANQKYKNYLEQEYPNVNANFTGKLPQSILFNELSKSSLNIMPSVSEGMPLSALQAISLNIPVLASSHSGLREVIGSSYIFPVRNKEALANMIEKFLVDKIYKDNCFKQMAISREKYSFSNFANRWNKISF